MVDLRSLSLKQLRALSAVLKSGSLTQAAQQLSVTPPAVTTHLKSLESFVGAPLFHRSSEGLAPTEMGRELLRLADEVETVIGIASNRLTALASGAEGSVVLGVVSTGKYFAPSLVAAFQKANPRVQVTLAIGNRGEIVSGLERREYDLLIMGRPPGHIATERALLGDHPHVLIAPPDHPLSADNDILPEDLMRETFLAREGGSGTRLLMQRFLDRVCEGRPVNIVEMGTNETIKQAVMAGLGVALISAHTCISELEDGRLAQLRYPGLPLMRQWYLLHRSDQSLTKAAEGFRTFVMEHRQTLLPQLNSITDATNRL